MRCHLLFASFSVVGMALFGCGSDGANTGGASSSTTTATTTSSSGTGTGTGGQGGGTSLVDHEVFGSGTRLRAEYVDAGQGAVDFARFHDLQLAQPCTFIRHEDGTMRCVPPTAYAGSFSDAACTVPLAESNTDNCQLPPAYAADITQLSSTCIGTHEYGTRSEQVYATKILALGSEVTPTMVYRKDTMGVCAATPANPSPSFHYWQVGSEIPSSTFVSATEATVMRGPRSAVIELVGDDGSYLLTSARDAQLDFECELGRQCLPRLQADIGNAYGDSSCTTPVAIVHNDGLSCPAPTLIHQAVKGAVCTPPTDLFFTPGAAVPNASVFASVGSCMLYSSYAGNLSKYAFYAVGAPLPVDTFFAVSPQSRGTGRVTATRFGLPTGELLSERPSFTDSSTGLACSPVRFADGKIRCAPDAEVSTASSPPLYFADAACTQPLYLLSKGACAPNNQYPAHILVPTGSLACVGQLQNPTISEVHQAVPFTSTMAYLKSSTCQPTGAPSGSFSLGPLVDASMFPEVQLVTD